MMKFLPDLRRAPRKVVCAGHDETQPEVFDFPRSGMRFVAAAGTKGGRVIAAIEIQGAAADPNAFGVVEGLLAGCAGLLVMLVVLLLRLRRRLVRIEKLAGTRTPVSVTIAEVVPSVAETSPGGAFEAFLMEDPERLKIPKREQFKAYRKWRQEKGMNWSAPATADDP